MNAKNNCFKRAALSFLAGFWLAVIGATCWMKMSGYDDGSWMEVRIISVIAMASFLVSVIFTVTSDEAAGVLWAVVAVPAVFLLLFVLFFIVALWITWSLPVMEDISNGLAIFVRLNLFAIPLGQYVYRGYISG